MKNLFFLAIVLIVSCSPVTIAYDYDKRADFTKYKTYAFTEESRNLGISQLDLERLFSALESEIAAKGFTKSDNPDVWFDIYKTIKRRTQATANTNTMGMGMGGMGMGGRPMGFGHGVGFANSTTTINYTDYIDGTLIVNMVDRSTEKIAWQGRGTRTLNDHSSAERRTKNINYAVKKIFTKYPPRSKRK